MESRCFQVDAQTQARGYCFLLAGPKDSCFTQGPINRRESCSALQEQCNQFRRTVGFGFPSAICEKTDLLNDWLQQNAQSFSIYLHARMCID